VPLVLLSKGIENSTGRLFLDVLAEELGFGDRLAVLSGPNHAEEVVRGMPAGTLVASADKAVAELFQASLAAQTFRVYTSEDCIGVQLCGATKNVFAIAAGLVAGMGLGDNLAALLMTRGLAETSRLVAASGGQQQTCMGLAGMGDLIVTCTSKHSRNRSFGVALAQGRTLKEYEEQTHMVVEGVYACRALPVLAQRLGVDMPISERVRDIVWDRRPVPEMLASLFDRPAKPEFY
jgi:glycerol-3-phosphate dehydrogenase (NAD(P)+)